MALVVAERLSPEITRTPPLTIDQYILGALKKQELRRYKGIQILDPVNAGRLLALESAPLSLETRERLGAEQSEDDGELPEGSILAPFLRTWHDFSAGDKVFASLQTGAPWHQTDVLYTDEVEGTVCISSGPGIVNHLSPRVVTLLPNRDYDTLNRHDGRNKVQGGALAVRFALGLSMFDQELYGRKRDIQKIKATFRLFRLAWPPNFKEEDVQ